METLESESDSGSGVKWLAAATAVGLVLGLVVVLVVGPLMVTAVYASKLFNDLGKSAGTGVICDYQGSEVETPDGQGGSVKFSKPQLSNAISIIQAGNEAGVGPQGQKIALMTALQESTLRNLANPGVAGSMSLTHEGTGSDHDSVGFNGVGHGRGDHDAVEVCGGVLRAAQGC